MWLEGLCWSSLSNSTTESVVLDSAATFPTDLSVEVLGVLAELGVVKGEESSWPPEVVG